MLLVLIQEPKQPENDIDVFLELLLEDMAKLWNDGLLIQHQESSVDERFEDSRHEVARLSCDDD